MLKIIRDQWNLNEGRLRSELLKTDLRELEYKDLVKLAFDNVYNYCLTEYEQVNIDRIHEIDDGDYQGTLLFLLPFCSYQPCEFEYLMTYVGYGSCSGCDTLESIKCHIGDVQTEQDVADFMMLCKDILTNTVKPYNGGWRGSSSFETAEEEVNG